MVADEVEAYLDILITKNGFAIGFRGQHEDGYTFPVLYALGIVQTDLHEL